MKFKALIALALVLVMVFAMTACDNGSNTPNGDTTTPKTENNTTPTPGTTTEKPNDTTTPKDNETTPAKSDDTTTPKAEDSSTPAPVVSVDPIEFDELSDADKAALKAVMPATLPGNTSYEIACRTFCFDNADEDYLIAGNSKGSATYVGTDGGAIFGKAVKFAGKADSKDSRGEIEMQCFGDAPIVGCKGIMFYVDFSNVAPNPDKPNTVCASVTINTNDIRSMGPENAVGSAVAYYYENGAWVQSTNITSCRIKIPDNFAGWIYVPASSFYDKTSSSAIGETFPDIFILSMRCYTDGYIYSADSYVIFDEITYVR